jgi:hypothetical protein
MGDTISASPVPDKTVREFRDFVEWILDIDLSPKQEEGIRIILTEEWVENDRETMALVEANLATFRAVRDNSNERFRENWRKHNQPVFVAALEKHASSDLGTSLLGAFQAAHPTEARQATSEKLTAGQIASGVLGFAGAVALAAFANRQQAKQELNESVSRDKGNSITDSIGKVIDAGKQEVEDLRETDPMAAAIKELENQQRNRELIDSWTNTNYNIGRTINANMVGDSWRWRT